LQNIEYKSTLALYDDILDSTNEGIIVTNQENKIVKINKACEQITGYNIEEVQDKNPKLFSSKKTDSKMFKAIWKQIAQNGYWIGELWNRHKDGTVYPIIIKIHKTFDQVSNSNFYYAVFSDISLQQESKDELFHLAYHDPLTNLPNRLKLKAQLEYVVSNSKRNELKFAILFLDLDNFKTVNDTLGHAYGDEVLISLANKFKNIVRTNDMVARVGGDEFIVVLSDITNYMFIERVCKKILAVVNKPFKASGKNFHIGVSIGIAIYPNNGDDIEKLIHNADAAMYHAKENGKNNFEFFSNEMNLKLLAYSQKEESLVKAIEEDEFVIDFQPEIDLSTNEVFSLEALARWNSKKDGLVLPGEFISDLESTKHIFEFEELILKKACTQLSKWQKAGIYNGTVSVNISGKHLEHGNILKGVKDALRDSNLEAKFLELEFSEADVMKISSKTLNVLSELSELGIGLAIDDFGTGFTSFNYLRECSISRLKIDKSYIDSLIEEESDEDIIKTIIDLGTNMGISVIAEGIEVPKQDEIIKKNSCTKVQGYFYARPMNPENFETWYKTFYN